METGDNPPKGNRQVPRLTPKGPFSDGNQYRWVPATEITEMRRTTHLRRLRARLGTETKGATPIETPKPEPESLLPGDFELYQAMLVDALQIDPEQAAIQSSALRERFEHGTPAVKKLMSLAIGSMFDALYPEENKSKK